MFPNDWVLFWTSLKMALRNVYPEDDVAFDITFSTEEAIDMDQQTALRDSCEQMIPNAVRQYFGIIDLYIRDSPYFYPDSPSGYYEMLLMWRRDQYNPFDDSQSVRFVID